MYIFYVWFYISALSSPPPSNVTNRHKTCPACQCDVVFERIIIPKSNVKINEISIMQL